jgi:hypothetical protein
LALELSGMTRLVELNASQDDAGESCLLTANIGFTALDAESPDE